MALPAPPSLGAVVIGRNEGERLTRCLRSMAPGVERIVYVDSGSSDGSVEVARELGADVVELEMDRPFTMARGRNAGFERMTERHPEVRFVQFVDGDCELRPDWMPIAGRFLETHSDVGAVCGRRRERFPEASVYNRLIDVEWGRAPIGDVAACGGDAMIRAEALRQVGGFDPVMIAGEEAELCCRLRLRGWRVVRLDAEMTLHDAAMRSFGQWWRRAVRGGHAFAEGAQRQGATALRHNVRELRSVAFWGLLLPLVVAVCLASAALLPAATDSPAPATLATVAGVLLLGYPVLALRIFLWRRRLGAASGDAALYAVFCAIGKVPEAFGVLTFLRNRHRQRSLIEYK